MSEVTDVNVDLIAAVLDLADPRDTRHYHRIKALCERLGTYMAMSGQQLSEERLALTQDFLTLTRTVGMQAKRLKTVEAMLADQSRNMRDFTQAIINQAEQITALNATVIELMDRVQGMEMPSSGTGSSG